MKACKAIPFALSLCSVLLLLGHNDLNAQHIDIGIKYIQGINDGRNWEFFKGGTEVSADYIFVIKDYKVNTGLDYRTVQWGNQLSISTGIIKELGTKYEIAAEIQNGLALFYSQSLYVFSGGLKFNYNFYQKGKVVVGLSLETRYTLCPAYKNYSLIYKVLEIPIGAFVRF